MRLRLRSLLFSLVLLVFGSVAQAKDFGLGVILGSPTGLSAKYYLGKINAIDGALAWSSGDHRRFHLHGDYLWHMPRLFDIKGEPVALYYGIGFRWRSWDHDNHYHHPSRHHDHEHDHDWSLGPRIPVGLSFTFRDPRIELFAELALAMDLVPETDADFDVGIGGRFYF